MPRKLTDRPRKDAPTPAFTDTGARIGRPELDLDAEQIQQLAAIQCSMAEIAAIVKCARTGEHPSVDTLERRFADVIEKGRHEGRMSLKRMQFTVAMGFEAIDKGGKGTGVYRVRPDTTMLIWLGKTVLGQKDTSVREMSGIDGRPIETRELSQLTDREVAEKIAGIIDIAERRAAKDQRERTG